MISNKKPVQDDKKPSGIQVINVIVYVISSSATFATPRQIVLTLESAENLNDVAKTRAVQAREA